MSDPAPSTDPVPPPDPSPASVARRECNWHRVRVYSWSILLILAMWFGATMVTIRLHPKRIVDDVLARLPFPSSTGKIYWLNRRTLKIDDVKLGGFFYADSVILTASPIGLWQHHVAKIQILGGQLYTKPLYAAMDKMNPNGPGDGLDWIIGRLEISRGTLWLDNLVADTSIPVRLGVRSPIVLNGIRLGKPDSSPQMTTERSAELVNVNIFSPVDPLAPVLFFPLIRVRFTYAEFWHHRVREVDLVRPTMFLGEDLFWFAKEFRGEHKSQPSVGPASPWEITHLEVQYGQLAINAFGQPVVHFPFYFDTKVDNIRLDQLDQLSVKSTIPIRRLDQDYPDYKVHIVNLSGNLYFSLPVTDATADNVVNTISIESISWNRIPAKDVSTTVTFDPNGVYGKLSGKCEGGNVDGNFEFYYTKGFTWNANLFAQKINCQPIAEKLVGKYVQLTGELDGNISVQGKATEILKCVGSLDLPNPGSLEIKSMDDLLDRLPKDTAVLKRDALKIAINTVQTYPYNSGQLKINYTPAGGVGTLKLDGPRGGRLFEAYFHPWALSDNSTASH
jgi:hypothetical protein